jgi:hypothetical protein
VARRKTYGPRGMGDNIANQLNGAEANRLRAPAAGTVVPAPVAYPRTGYPAYLPPAYPPPPYWGYPPPYWGYPAPFWGFAPRWWGYRRW